ncbi:MAG TPA: hypothetical protein VFA32_02140, partial [Dehalococcoidia bacterium]|nr:hypothetical protein [Dehalococcoidia bacterium]
MRLLGKGFSVNGKADLVGTVMACWDNGKHTGFEDTVNLSNLKDREKLIDKLVSSLTVSLEEARAAVTNLLIQLREASDSAETRGYSDAVEEERKSQATLLVGLALAKDVELWHTPDAEPFASLILDDYQENWPVRSRGFRDFLAHHFFVQKAKVPGAQAVQDALSVLGGKALFEGQEHEVYTRVAEHENKIYIDLVNDRWEAVEISPLGWTITTGPPVRFRRSRGMLALPIPKKGGGLGPLRELLNIPEDSDWALFVACLIQAFRPKGPYPVLVIHGEHGSAKTTTCRVFRALIDPHRA